MASVRIGSADGVALLASAVRNTLKLFSAQWRFTTALCCDAGAVGGMIFNRWLADCDTKGIAIEWEDLL